MIKALPILLSLALCAALATAADGVCSKDGRTVYWLDLAGGGITEIDLAGQKAARAGVQIPGTEVQYQGLALASDGRLIIATTTAVWEWNPGKKAAAKIADVPEGRSATGVAFNPVSGDILVALATEKEEQSGIGACIIRKGANKALPVFTRRVEIVWSPVFDADGTLYFAGGGDLWIATLDTESEPDVWGAVMNGFRLAPLAVFQTDISNASSSVVAEIAVARERVAVNLAERHSASLLTLEKSGVNAANLGDSAAFVEPAPRHELYRKQLQSLKDITPPDANLRRHVGLCSLPDGGHVFHVQGEAGAYEAVVTDLDGKVTESFSFRSEPAK